MGISSKVEKLRKKGVFKVLLSRLKKRRDNRKNLTPIRKYHLVSAEQLQAQSDAFFQIQPKISIITPLYNTDLKFLEELLLSVKQQTYENWELCLGDGSDLDHSGVEALVHRYAIDDSRIVYNRLEKNEGIVGNTNACIKFATGEYLGLLDHDDVLHPSALYEVVKEIQNNADFIYTDEMKFKKDYKKECDIVCKSGFGKYELQSHNYICHFVVFKKTLIDEWNQVYRYECEGSQDYDMVLRLTEKAEKIVHIPKILYYWRVHAGSVAMDISVKQYAVDAAKRAISTQLKRHNEIGNVECNYPYQTIYKVAYMIQNSPKVSIVMWGECEKYQERLNEILSNTGYLNIEIVTNQKIVSNEVAIRELEYINDEKRYEWFNRTVTVCDGTYMVFLNWNIVPKNRDWIKEMLMYAQKEDVCAVGAHILYRDNRTFYAGACLDRDSDNNIYVLNYDKAEGPGYEANQMHVRNTTIISSMCMMISKKEFEQQEEFSVHHEDLGDADFCMHGIEKHKWNVWTCFAKVYYNGNKQIKDYWKKNDVFSNEWKNQIEQGDPYLHPLLKQLNLI
ncbi:MAG: glycosyltransferase [Hespellia sp.]|nr:glycosyltransferase [Hespellia sp.]